MRNILALPGFKKYFANISWLIVQKIIHSVVVLVVGVYVVRYLGPERFGLLSYTISFVSLFSAISILGLDGIVVRELVKDENRRKELLGTAFFLKLTGALFVLVITSIVSYATSNDNLTRLLVFIIALSTVFQSFNVIDFYFQSRVLSKYVVYAQVTSLIVSSVVKLYLIWIAAPLLYFGIIYLVESIFLAFGLVIVYIRHGYNIFSWRPRLDLSVVLLRNSWPLILSGFCISVYMRIDQVMIKQMLGSEAVGQYAAAVRLSELWYFIPVLICNSLFPAIISARNRGDEFYNSRLQKLYDLMLWITVPITIVITLSSGVIVRFLYGAEFSEAGSVLSIHVWAGIFVFLGVASSKWFLAENLQFYLFVYEAIGAIINVGLNLILIKKIGIVGAALATVISYGFAAYLLNFARTETRNNFYRLSQTFNVFRIVQSFRHGIYEEKY